MLPSISPHQSPSSTSYPTLKDLHVENIWAFIQRHWDVDMMCTWRCGETFCLLCEQKNSSIKSCASQASLFWLCCRHTHKRTNANKINANWIRAAFGALVTNHWVWLFINGQLTAWVACDRPLPSLRVHWHLTGLDSTPCWSQTSADGKDHHPVFSLGAVGRVHITKHVCQPLSTRPPLLWTRQPVSAAECVQRGWCQ